MNRPLPAALSHWVARSQQWAAGHRLQIANCLVLGRRLVDQLFLPHLRRWFPALGARQADHLPEVEGNLDQADWAALPRQPGWSRNDWQPKANGPIRTLTLHSQSQPDAIETSPADTPQTSPWRFEVTIVYSRGLTATIVGRLDPEGLRLLIRSDRALGPTSTSHLTGLAAKMRLEDQRPVSQRFDAPRSTSHTVPSRTGVDQRA